MRRFFDAFNRRFARFHTSVYRATRGWLGHRMTGRVTSLLLHTTGRKTGLTRSVALAYSKAGNDYLLVASNFGGDRPPAWFVNLEADPRAAVHVGRHHIPVTAHVLMPGDPDYGRLFAIANAGTQGRYERYRTITKRPLPVVRLTPDR
ncbi:MAG: nitroreductase/quinone reductase family protein [Acidimicrobiales bacterium]